MNKIICISASCNDCRGSQLLATMGFYEGWNLERLPHR